MRQDTITVQGFLLEFFCTKAMFTLEHRLTVLTMSWMEKIENEINGEGWGVVVGIGMSWVEKFPKIN